MSNSYSIHQFEDKALSHFAYAIVSQSEIVLIDPARNPQLYYDFAKQQNAKIVGVIETHPHADFVSSHLEIYNTTQASIYASKKVEAAYPHISFDDGDSIKLGTVLLKALNTPGHSPDSISIVLESDGNDKAVFTGDTLFIGDCGRPDLRENTGSISATRIDLAMKMYYSLRNKLMPLQDDVLIYPAHGAGTLCGKALSEANSSTIGLEKISNWSLQNSTEKDFVNELISGQPIVPKYFGFDVDLNRKGANAFLPSINAVNRMEEITDKEGANRLEKDILIIDTRSKELFKKGHLTNSLNLMIGVKFETWLGSIVAPKEPFYLQAETETQLEELIERIAKIGYEKQIKGVFTSNYFEITEENLDINQFTNHLQDYTIVDIRNVSEVKEKQFFATAINIPLSELRERADEIPTDKPIVVHCAGGYRSAVGSSIIKNSWRDKIVYDLSEAITKF